MSDKAKNDKMTGSKKHEEKISGGRLKTAAIIIAALSLGFAGYGIFTLCFSKNCAVPVCKNSASVCKKEKSAEGSKAQNSPKSSSPVSSVYQEKADFCCQNFKNSNIDATVKGSFPKFDFSFKGSANQSCDNCFWLVIFFLSVALLILFFVFVSDSSREKSLLRFFMEYREIEKEIKIEEIKSKKEIEIEKIKKCSKDQASKENTKQ